MWVARNQNNKLYIFNQKPIKIMGINGGYWAGAETIFDYMEIDENLFPELKWEDEPIEVFLNTGYDMGNQINHVWSMLKCTQDELNKANERAMYYATKYEAIKKIIDE